MIDLKMNNTYKYSHRLSKPSRNLPSINANNSNTLMSSSQNNDNISSNMNPAPSNRFGRLAAFGMGMIGGNSNSTNTTSTNMNGNSNVNSQQTQEKPTALSGFGRHRY